MWSSWPWVSTMRVDVVEPVPDPGEVRAGSRRRRAGAPRGRARRSRRSAACRRARRPSCCGRSRPGRRAATIRRPSCGQRRQRVAWSSRAATRGGSSGRPRSRRRCRSYGGGNALRVLTVRLRSCQSVGGRARARAVLRDYAGCEPPQPVAGTVRPSAATIRPCGRTPVPYPAGYRDLRPGAVPPSLRSLGRSREPPRGSEERAVRKRLLVLGGGHGRARWSSTSCAGGWPRDEWEITVVDRDDEHLYQPGYLFLPFGAYTPRRRSSGRGTRFLPDGVDFVLGEVDRVDADGDTRAPGGRPRASPTTTWSSPPARRPRPDQTPGHARPASGARSIFDFYTLDGATALAEALRGLRRAAGWSCTSPTCRSSARSRRWSSPSSPTRGFAERGMRDRVEIVYVTPLPGAFTKPIASRAPGRDARRAQDRRRDRLPGRAHRPRDARRSCPTTSARSRSTCWSPSR